MQTVQQRYLAQLKKSLLNALNRDVPMDVLDPPSLEVLLQPGWFEHFWEGDALTMCSPTHLDNTQFCIEDCLERGVPGDLIECGVWRGGMSIFMRGVLAAHGVTDRKVWVADSFQGLPTPPANSVDEVMYNFPQVVDVERFRVDLTKVKGNFARYGLLDEQVNFLPGWFNETLPTAPIEQLAVLRLDGDYYTSTWETLESLYPKLSPGGYVIIDDWGLGDLCGEQEAVLDYRREHRITDEILPVDYHTAYWRKRG
jgi:O-methyltransferase